jgi:hypothetical protein
MSKISRGLMYCDGLPKPAPAYHGRKSIYRQENPPSRGFASRFAWTQQRFILFWGGRIREFATQKLRLREGPSSRSFRGELAHTSCHHRTALFLELFFKRQPTKMRLCNSPSIFHLPHVASSSFSPPLILEITELNTAVK